MKTKLIFAASLWLIFAACQRQKGDQPNNTPTIPKALEDKNVYQEIQSKVSRGEDMVESLYAELAEKDKAITTIEKNLELLDDSKLDSTKSLNVFKQKNAAYYNSVENKINVIRDSLLKQRIKKLITDNIKTYEAKISNHEKVLQNINEKEVNIHDLHLVLKIYTTLPIMDAYQKNKLPSLQSLTGYLQQQQTIIQQLNKQIGN